LEEGSGKAEKSEPLCVCACLRERVTTGASLPAEKKPSQFLSFWRVLGHREITAMPTRSVPKVRFSSARLRTTRGCRSDPLAASRHTLSQGDQLPGQVLEAAQDPHPLPTLKLKPTRTSGNLSSFAGASVATWSFAAGMELGGRPGGCTPLPVRPPAG